PRGADVVLPGIIPRRRRAAVGAVDLADQAVAADKARAAAGLSSGNAPATGGIVGVPVVQRQRIAVVGGALRDVQRQMPERRVALDAEGLAGEIPPAGAVGAAVGEVDPVGDGSLIDVRQDATERVVLGAVGGSFSDGEGAVGRDIVVHAEGKLLEVVDALGAA